MLESIIFIGLIIIFLLSLLAAIILIIVGLIVKNRNIMSAGFYSLLVPVLCFFAAIFYYGIVVRLFNNKNVLAYSGRYVLDQSDSYNINKKVFSGTIYHLALYKNNSFELDKTPCIDFYGKGNWEADCIDGEFCFKNANNELLGTASPFDNGQKKIIFNLYDKQNEVIFIKVE